MPPGEEKEREQRQREAIEDAKALVDTDPELRELERKRDEKKAKP